MRAKVWGWLLAVLICNQILMLYYFLQPTDDAESSSKPLTQQQGAHTSTGNPVRKSTTSSSGVGAGGAGPGGRHVATLLTRSGTGRKPVACHPEVCEHAMCDESCGQVPKIITECKGSACHSENPRLLYKAQLSYPAFVMPLPSFIHPEMEQRFLNIGAVRETYMKEHGKCPSPFALPGENRCDIIGEYNSSRELVFTHKRYIYGEITIIKDGIWSGRPYDRFGKYECWEQSDYKWILTSEKEPTESFKKAVVMLTPQTGGAYYQHFIDRGWSKIVQAWDLIKDDPEIKILVSPSYKRHPNVEHLWRRFGLADRLVYVTDDKPVHAEEMIFPCKATHYHPLVYERAQRYIGINPDVPLDKRKKIVYFSRKGKSRPVSNEEALLSGVRKWMKENNRPEELIVFQHKDWDGKFDEMLEFFNEEVLAVFGPHGGAFYNAFYTARNTLVIEFFPIDLNGNAYRWPECIWWPAHFLGLRYYQLPIHTATASVNVDHHLVTDIFQKELPPLQR